MDKEEKKKKVLLVGEHPESFTGNGNMILSAMDEIDIENYQGCLLAINNISINMIENPYEMISKIPFPIIYPYSNDDWKKQLINFLQIHEIDILVGVGIDIWRYTELFATIKQIQLKKNFIFKLLIPYDLDHIRYDWIDWMKYLDQVFIYSEYGYNLLKEYLSNSYYFRPKFPYHEAFMPGEDEEKRELRHKLFPDINDKTTIFGYIGVNQLRKNILNLVAGFKEVLKERNDVLLYLHLNSSPSQVSIERLCNESNIPEGYIRTNGDMFRKLYPSEMTKIYKILDCHILPSFQEGLSWTVIEAKLSGIPSIVSNTTAHKDYIPSQGDPLNNGIIPIEPDDKSYLNLVTEYGYGSPVSVSSCSPEAIKSAIIRYLDLSQKSKEIMKTSARTTGLNWIRNCSHFTKDLLNVEIEKEKTEEIGELI